jgi:hypothetical protein
MSALIANIIVSVILILIVSGACYYIYKEKKKGNHCIGCPMAASCPRKTVSCQKNSRK